MNQIQEPILQKLTGTDLPQCSGGVLFAAAGLSGVKKSRISSITQIKSKAETVQVVTLGNNSYTPTSNTVYQFVAGDTNRTRGGGQEQLKVYSYTTGTVTGVAATDREVIHVALVAAVTADNGSNFITAATLGGGAGFTVTDAANYYTPFSQSTRQRLGATYVRPVANDDDSGFSPSAYTITTPAVYSSGLGANLLASLPVIDGLYGGLLSGYFSNSLDGTPFKTVAGASPVSGQNYDIFVICALTEVQAHNQRGQLAFCPKVQLIAVDNGTGSDTGNASGFAAYEKEILRHAFSLYNTDPSALWDFFDSGATFGNFTDATTGLVAVAGVPLGDTGDVNIANTGKSMWHYNMLGASQTKIVPNVTASGLQTDLDATDNNGTEFVPHIGANNPVQYVIGKTEFSGYFRVTATDISDVDFLMFGFRKKEAFTTALATYTDIAGLGIYNHEDATQSIDIITNLNDAASPTVTATTLTWADTATKEFYVTVNAAGLCKFYVNGSDKTGVQVAQFSFDAGDTVIPFIWTELGTSSAPAIVVSRFASVPAIWRA